VLLDSTSHLNLLTALLHVLVLFGPNYADVAARSLAMLIEIEIESGEFTVYYLSTTKNVSVEM
jgi:hypothetical protein